MIEIKGVCKSFNRKPVLSDLYLTVRDGETLSILGKTGSGKTVLLKHIVGLIQPDLGIISVDGEQVNGAKQASLYRIRQAFGYVFQAAALFDSMDVFENVALPLSDQRRFPKETIEERVMHVLNLVGMEESRSLYPVELSGGMKKRVGIARALVTGPTYVLYDEPTAGLDPVMANRINELILDLKRRLKVTAVVVTHDLGSAMKISDRIALLCDGRIVFESEPCNVCSSDCVEMREFIESSGLNDRRLELTG
jgi:phospholipid/cholesterol/gamma-HCH transport system ATP-binding protein